MKRGTAAFVERLSLFGIEDFGPNWTSVRNLRVPEGVPEMVEIPEDAVSPAPRKRAEMPDMDSMKAEFSAHQLSFLSTSMSDYTKPEEDTGITRPVIDLGIDCSDLSDYILLKRKVATHFREKSKAYRWETPVEVCANARCLNAAIPGFMYCVHHLPDDPNFTKQPFLRRCQYRSGGFACPAPCSTSVGFCRAHMKRKR